jgi:hypothetical protein|tara:strand:+ start:798 stop:1085 length:288 start_codon:yes stop_codon:yes gene_type:complete
MEPDFKAAFNILMDYWDCIPEEEHKIVDQKLKLVLDEPYVTYATNDKVNMGVQKGCNSPSKALSHNYDSPPKDCIKRVLKRLRDTMGFGIPDQKG